MSRPEIIRHSAESISENLSAKEEFVKEVLGGKQLIVVNLTFDEDVKCFRDGCRILEDNGLGKEVDDFNETIFGSKDGPQSASDVFKVVMGRKVDIVEFNPFNNNKITDVDDAGAILFSGCPVHINLEMQKNPQRIGFTETSAFKAAKGVYDEVSELGIPLIGICYGHEVMVHQNGGEVPRLDTLVEEERTTLINSDQGIIYYAPPYFHHRIAAPKKSVSESIMTSNVNGFADNFPTGVIHIDGDKGRYGISMQAHPELISIMHRIISVGMSGDPSYIDATTLPDGHKELMGSIAAFLEDFKEER